MNITDYIEDDTTFTFSANLDGNSHSDLYEYEAIAERVTRFGNTGNSITITAFDSLVVSVFGMSIRQSETVDLKRLINYMKKRYPNLNSSAMFMTKLILYNDTHIPELYIRDLEETEMYFIIHGCFICDITVDNSSIHQLEVELPNLLLELSPKIKMHNSKINNLIIKNFSGHSFSKNDYRSVPSELNTENKSCDIIIDDDSYIDKILVKNIKDGPRIVDIKPPKFNLNKPLGIKIMVI